MHLFILTMYASCRCEVIGQKLVRTFNSIPTPSIASQDTKQVADTIKGTVVYLTSVPGICLHANLSTMHPIRHRTMNH